MHVNNSKLIGAILLIIGTSVGAGMLGLPIATAQSGFLGALLLLLCSWVAMTFGAFLIVEIMLWLPEKSNFISAAQQLLGKTGAGFTWIIYCLLFYSLLAAYIDGGADMLQNIAALIYIYIPERIDAVVFLLIFGGVVYCGIRWTDWVNRSFVVLKFASLTLLLILIVPHVHFKPLLQFHAYYLFSAITVVFTSFGFASVVPSLRDYLQSDVKKLRVAILIGSLIPLLLYILWVAVILVEVPVEGVGGLHMMMHSAHATSQLTMSLIKVANNSVIDALLRTFTSICVITSFLGVSIAFTDFLADGLNLPKVGLNRLIVHVLVFLPPFLVVWWYPQAFIMALSYGGILCALLLVILPAWMVYLGRYQFNIAATYRVWGGKPLLAIAVMISLIVILQQIFHGWI